MSNSSPAQHLKLIRTEKKQNNKRKKVSEEQPNNGINQEVQPGGQADTKVIRLEAWNRRLENLFARQRA